MTLPPDLQFSQGSLQDFVECRRRFQLRYLERLAWPAVAVEPALENERHLQDGARFHRMVQQHVAGVPAERLSGMDLGENLDRWWQNYLRYAPADLPGQRQAEVTLSAPLEGPGDWRLVAKLDLVVITPEGRAVILDWKTSRRRSTRAWLAQRLQTRVYPYLLVQAGADLNGGQALAPEQMEMAYWFADYPQDPERFAYDAQQFAEDGAYIRELVRRVQQLDEAGGIFPLTPYTERCQFCVYRSLCDRGVQAGQLGDLETADLLPESGFDLDLDFEQVAEVVY